MPDKSGESTIGQRVRAARLHAGITKAAEFARRLNVTRSAVYEWESGRSEPGAESLRNIALITTVSYDWLATGRGSKFPLTHTLHATGAAVVGIAAADVWREGKAMKDQLGANEHPQMTAVPSIPRPDLVDMKQYAVEVNGISSDATVRPGEFAIFVPYAQARAGGPQDGDLVVVEKHRGTTEHKTMLMRLRFVGRSWQLHHESNTPHWREQVITLSQDLKRDMSDKLSIDLVGLVIGVYRDDLRPRYGGAAQSITRAVWRTVDVVRSKFVAAVCDGSRAVSWRMAVACTSVVLLPSLWTLAEHLRDPSVTVMKRQVRESTVLVGQPVVIDYVMHQIRPCSGHVDRSWETPGGEVIERTRVPYLGVPAESYGKLVPYTATIAQPEGIAPGNYVLRTQAALHCDGDHGARVVGGAMPITVEARSAATNDGPPSPTRQN
jgi:transcriptional regulator with XRE-family HTH domain